MKQKRLLLIATLFAVVAMTIAAFKLGQTHAPDQKVADLDSRIADLDARLEDNELQQLKLRLRNLQTELKRRQQAESAVHENYKFENIESRMASIKLHFNDLQREVATGRFPGLALTPAYQQLRQIFDNPEFDRLVRAQHTSAVISD